MNYKKNSRMLSSLLTEIKTDLGTKYLGYVKSHDAVGPRASNLTSTIFK